MRKVESVNCPDGLSCMVVHDSSVYCVNWSNSLFFSKDADLPLLKAVMAILQKCGDVITYSGSIDIAQSLRIPIYS